MHATTALQGWLALAEETKRVDRLSSTLGLDSPAPGGLSQGSAHFNTASVNAFRFLPFLQDAFPDLLKQTSGEFEAARPIENPIPDFAVSRHASRDPRHPAPVPTFSQALPLAQASTVPRVSQSASAKQSTSPLAGNSAPSPSKIVSPVPIHGPIEGTTYSSLYAPSSSTSTPESAKYPAWPQAKPPTLIDLFDWDAIEDDHPVPHHIDHRHHHQQQQQQHHHHQHQNHHHHTYATPLEMDFHRLGMEEEHDDSQKTSLDILHYQPEQEEDDRVWRWLHSRVSSPVYFEEHAVGSGHGTGVIGDSWIPQREP